MKSKTSDDVKVIRTSFERGKLRTFVDEREWRFPRLMKVLEFHDYFLFNNYELDFLIKDKRIVAVVFPGNIIQNNPM
jgi:hypothetical protein